MGLLEPITHKKEIQDLLDEAQSKYDSSKKQFEAQKEKTTQSLEKLGKIKVDAWSTGMDSFVREFGAFKNVEVIQTLDTNLNFVGRNEEPAQMILNIQSASMTASEVARAGVAMIGTGALVGIASYGGAMMFGTASTGTAIAALNGAAKTNATLAWFGGGSIKAGGLGMAGGKLVLAGVVVAPIIAVAALITNAKSKEQLAEAKKIHAEASDAAAKMDTITTGMQAIAKMSDNYSRFIKSFSKKFQPFIKELNRIKSSYATEDGQTIDFNLLTQAEQKTLHLSWLMAQIYYHVLSTPILTDTGNVSSNADSILHASTKEIKQIRQDTFKMVGEDAQVGNLIWTSPARKMIAINFVVMACLIIIGVKAMSNSIFAGIVCFVGSAIAFPIFIKFRDLPQSRQFMWRVIRAMVSILFVIIFLAVF